MRILNVLSGLIFLCFKKYVKAPVEGKKHEQ